MADLKPISAFNAASAVDANTLFLVSTPNGADYDSENASAALVADAVVNDFEYTQDLSTVSKKVTGGINENKSVIGYSYDEYDPTTAYSKDDLCIYNNTLYKAKQATTGNLPTNTTYWEPTSIADEIGRIDTALAPLIKQKMQSVYCSNGTRIWIKRLGTSIQVEINEYSQKAFSTSWENVYTDNTYQTRAYIDSDLLGSATLLYVPIGLVNGHQIILKIEKSTREIQIICDVNTAIYPQGSGVYTLA